MATITVSEFYPVTQVVLWEELRHIDRHVNWMTDAVAIEFSGAQREGVGTEFRCTTKVGPLVTKDLMTITQWDEQLAMGVTHRGVVGGSGVFVLSAESSGTTLTWTEQLDFPWFTLGALGALTAKSILRLLWAKNLKELGRHVARSN